jgi:hypothetical protein
MRLGDEGRAFDDGDIVENFDWHEILSGANLSRIMPPCNADRHPFTRSKKMLSI